jgi:hypothetical protein
VDAGDVVVVEVVVVVVVDVVVDVDGGELDVVTGLKVDVVEDDGLEPAGSRPDPAGSLVGLVVVAPDDALDVTGCDLLDPAAPEDAVPAPDVEVVLLAGAALVVWVSGLDEPLIAEEDHGASSEGGVVVPDEGAPSLPERSGVAELAGLGLLEGAPEPGLRARKKTSTTMPTIDATPIAFCNCAICTRRVNLFSSVVRALASTVRFARLGPDMS